MIRYISDKRRRKNANTIYLGSDLIISFGVYGGPEVQHQLQGKPLLYQTLRTTGDWCRHKLPKPKNRQEVRAFFRLTRPRFRYEHEWADLRKDFISQYYAPQPKEWSQVLPDNVALWASRRLQEITRELSFVDNYRVARVGNTCQERRYRRQQKRGCCGFLDVINVCPIDGKPYRLGCNYGH